MRILALVLLVACSKQETKEKPVVVVAPAEIKRAQDACDAYVAKACGCTAPAAQHECAQAKALPQALTLAIGVAVDPTSKRQDSLAAQVNMRETEKQCIEQTAKLPALGCQ